MCSDEVTSTAPSRCFSLDDARVPPCPLHLAVGMFDGVHRGHRAVIEAAVQSARREQGWAGVLTFRPHPSRLFNPDHPTRLIMTAEAQLALFAGLGVDIVIEHAFTRAFASIEAPDFPLYLKTKLPSLKALYVGRNFRFGRGRKGDAGLLLRCARPAGLSVHSAPRVTHNGEPISSTRIRDALQAGDMAEANALLGHCYHTRAILTPGKKLGHTLGFPTLNLPHDPELRPRFGVYAVRLRLPGTSSALPGVANYGIRPTVENNAAQPLLEVHLLEAREFKPGTPLEAEWLHFFRPEQKFPSTAALSTQIARDVAQAQTFFSK